MSPGAPRLVLDLDEDLSEPSCGAFSCNGERMYSGYLWHPEFSFPSDAVLLLNHFYDVIIPDGWGSEDVIPSRFREPL